MTEVFVPPAHFFLSIFLDYFRLRTPQILCLLLEPPCHVVSTVALSLQGARPVNEPLTIV